jgi:hypothetical protein
MPDSGRLWPAKGGLSKNAKKSNKIKDKKHFKNIWVRQFLSDPRRASKPLAGPSRGGVSPVKRN